ncbi:MAG: hypothetical protein ABIW76_17170 [Fibrobacteria bacterium]
MTDRFIETQDLVLEVETLDSTLGNHTGRKICFIPPDDEGMAGVIADVEEVVGAAVAGKNGTSVNQGESITLALGVYVFWSESVNSAGKKRVSPAFEVLVEKRGTVRR